MVRCSACETDNPGGARFCDGCGAALERVCQACSAPNRPDARFCNQCGAGLGADAPPPPSRPVLGGGERKQVTILFADVRGSTGLVRDVDPELAMSRLDPVVRGIAAAVHRYGGVVNEVQGDGVMALFGAPLAAEDHAVRACLAACAALGNLPGGIEVRIGVHSGEVVVRPTGQDAGDYAAIGAPVFLAKRLEQSAEPNTARLSAEAARGARGFTDVRPLGKMIAKGWDDPVEVFQLLAATARPNWEVRSTAAALSPFIGREVEMAALNGAQARTMLGRGQAVVVVSDTGVGKSRLVHEFLAEAPGRGWRVLRAAAGPHDEGTAFRLVAELLRSWIGASGQDDQATVERKLTQALALLGAPGSAPGLDRASPELDAAALRALLDLPATDGAWASLSPGARRRRLVGAMRLLLLQEAQVQPLLVLAEDLHHTDAPSLDLLNALVGEMGGAHLMLLATTRPDRRPDWRAFSYCAELRLGPLSDAESDQLLRDLVGEGDELGELRRRIVVQAEGTPLFLEEIARALKDDGTVVHTAAQRRLTAPADRVVLPGTVQAIVASRLDRLPPPERALLQTAAVLGKDFRVDVLRALSEQPEAAVVDRLAALQAAEFVYETSPGTGAEFTFRHALMQVVAYGTLLHTQRTMLHARALTAHEAVGGDRLGEMTERLSDHATAGEAWDAAYRYGLLAGERANACFAWREAIGYFDRALDALTHLPPGAETTRRGIELRLALRQALVATVDFGRLGRVMDEARTLAFRSGDLVRASQLDGTSCMMLTVLGSLDRAIEVGERGRQHAIEIDHEPSMLTLDFGLAQAHWFRGDFERAIALLEGSRHLARGRLRTTGTATNGTVSVMSLVCLAKTYAITGAFDRADAAAAEALAIAEETGRAYDRSYAQVAPGFIDLMRGEHDRAIAALEAGLSVARASGIELLQPSVARYLGRAYAHAGRHDDARALLREASELVREQSLIGFGAWCRVGEGHAEAEPDRSEQVFEEALEAARRHGLRPVEVHCLLALGELQRRRGATDEAATSYRAAIALASLMSMRPDQAEAERGLAACLAGEHAFQGATP